MNFDKNENSNWESKGLVEHFHYVKNKEDFIEFANWISEKLQTRKFLDKVNRFIEIQQLLETEPKGLKRTKLVYELSRMI